MACVFARHPYFQLQSLQLGPEMVTNSIQANDLLSLSISSESEHKILIYDIVDFNKFCCGNRTAALLTLAC